MARTARQQSFFDSEAENFRLSNNLSTNKRLWTVEERGAFIRHMAAFIEANPQIFDVADVERASEVRNIKFNAELPNNIFSMISEFTGESLNEAERINPFSDLNLGKTQIVLGLSIIAVAAVVTYKLIPSNK